MRTRTYHRHRLWCLGLATAIAACGGTVSTVDSAGLLPNGAHDPHAYTEAFLATHPAAVLRPSHLAILELEPTQGANDTGAAPGVDSVAYFLDHSSALTLSIDTSADQVGAVVLRDSRGAQTARLEHGSATFQADAGRYLLEVHHARAGDPSAPTQVVFLRPLAATDGLALQASNNCVNCTYDGSTIQNQHFDGLNLSGSTFHGAMVTSSTFTNATMVSCDFSGSFTNEELTLVKSCDFSGANLTAANFSGGAIEESVFGGPPPILAAILTEATFGAVTAAGQVTQIASTDFRNATLSGAKFLLLFSSSVQFQGADLSNTNFTVTSSSGLQSSCEGCSFGVEPGSGRATNLSESILSQAGSAPLMLSANTDLSGANLTGAQLANGAFQNLIFTGATFDEANLSGADLDGSTFTNASFAGATLDGASLNGTNLVGVHMGSGVALDGTMLNAATLDNAQLNEANAFTADLEGVSLANASLVGTNLDYANLRGAHLAGAQLGVPVNSGQSAASLVGVYMPDADLTSADLRGVDLSGAHIYGDLQQSKLNGALLDGADLSGAICSGSAFVGASLTDAALNGAQLVNCSFSNADLTRAAFDSAYLQGASFVGATSVAGARLDNAAVATIAGSWTYTEQNGMPVPYAYGPTQLGAFASDTSVTCPDAQDGPCTADTLNPVNSGPFPPIPTCVPLPPNYNNCNRPVPPATPTPVATLQ